MKKLIFPALISCSLLAAAQTFGQSFTNDNNSSPVLLSPADHSAFVAYAENNIVIMRWATGNEKGVDHYVIEHSADSVHFDPLHQVVSKSAIDMDSSYQDADPYPISPVNYYRLVTVNSDGVSEYSPAVRVDVNTARTPVLEPSVIHVGSTLRLDPYTDQLYQINFFTANGQLIKAYTVNSSSFTINTTGWPVGMYFYRISGEHQPLVTAGKILVI
jgi:hypothetical protein